MEPARRPVARRRATPEDAAADPPQALDFSEVVRPLCAHLTAQMLDEELFCRIEISLAPFTYEDELHEEPVRLECIDFNVRDWRELENREFVFPRNPQEGYVDGSLYLGSAHRPADLTRLQFGAIDGDSIDARFYLDFDLQYEGDTPFGTPSVVWQLPVQFDAAELDRQFAEANDRSRE